MKRPAMFTPEGWPDILRHIEKQELGGITMIAIEVLRTTNEPRVTLATFSPEARERLRRALQGEKRRAA
jgi:hypothetical protein